MSIEAQHMISISEQVFVTGKVVGRSGDEVLIEFEGGSRFYMNENFVRVMYPSMKRPQTIAELCNERFDRIEKLLGA